MNLNKLLTGIKSVAHINIAVAIVSTSCLLLFCVVALIYGDVKNLYEARDPTTGLSGRKGAEVSWRRIEIKSIKQVFQYEVRINYDKSTSRANC